MLLSYGLEVAHGLRRVLGEQPLEQSLWEDFLSLRWGPGADEFYAWPHDAADNACEDHLLLRAAQLRALVDAVRATAREPGQAPLAQVLHRHALHTQRQQVAGPRLTVALRLGRWFTTLEVGDEHPRQLRDRMEQALLERARPLRPAAPPRTDAALLIALDPVPLERALHLHQVGIDGPFLAWSQTDDAHPLHVLAAHHLAVEGPAFIQLLADVRRRARALRIALGLGGAGAPSEELVDELVQALLSGDPPAAPQDELLIDGESRELPAARLELNLSPELERLRHRRPRGWALPHRLRLDPTPALCLRLVSVDRGLFSFSAFAYAFCRAQHDALVAHDPDYDGRGFTFVVPSAAERDGRSHARSQRPVLCAFRTAGGRPESATTFRTRLGRVLAQAERDEDLLSRVLSDGLQVAVPRTLKAALVRVADLVTARRGSFLGGRSVVSQVVVPEGLLDPEAEFGGPQDGFFGGSCQGRSGVTITAIERGSRRDLCAVGSGLFARPTVMDAFWTRFGELLREQRM